MIKNWPRAIHELMKQISMDMLGMNRLKVVLGWAWRPPRLHFFTGKKSGLCT